jgi:enoyl-CoA hydratase/carnithine racemase
MKNEPALKRSDRDGIATLTLNRPQQRNALSRALIAELHDALRRIADDRSVRVVVLAGAGPAFCSGHDLKEMRANTEPAFYEAVFGACSAMMLAIVKLPQPVIARVHATATAAGCQLVASCDLAIAADSATFATPGVNIGLFCSTPMVAVSRNLPRKHVMEMLLTGEAIDAATAARLGLINRAVPAAELDDAVDALARRIVAKSPLTLTIGKEAFYRQLEMSQADAYDYASAVMARNMATRDAAEGIDAFLAKRQPTWCGA